MTYESETCRTDGRETDVLAAWEIYIVAIATLTIYSLLSTLA